MKKDLDELYIINYRYSYLLPVCFIEDDNECLKILVNNRSKDKEENFINTFLFLTFIFKIIIILTIFNFLNVLFLIITLFTIGALFIILIKDYLHYNHQIYTNSKITKEILTINKHTNTIKLSLYNDFSNKKLNSIELPTKLVSKIFAVTQLVITDVYELPKDFKGSLCLPPDSEYNPHTNKIYSYYKFNNVIIIYFDNNQKNILESIEGLKIKELKEGVTGSDFGPKLYYGFIYTNNNQILSFLPLPYNFHNFQNTFQQYFKNIEYKHQSEISLE